MYGRTSRSTMSGGRLVRLSIASIATVIATHALAYYLMAFLPDAATRMSALLGGYEPAVSALRAKFEHRTYPETLFATLSGDFGTSVDGVPVVIALGEQLADTIPRLLVALTIVAMAAWLALRSASIKSRQTPLLDFVCLTPPYVHAFIALFVLFLSGGLVSTQTGSIAWCMTIIVAAIAPSALVSAQATTIMASRLASDYALFARSMGLNELEIRKLLYHDAWISLVPSLERTVLWLFLSLIFAEIVFSLPGFGSGFASALRRSDINILLAQILLLAAISNLARMVSGGFRAFYGIAD